jgi:sulfatase maturation enzyme AslB (radical SAM superfamily)
MDLKLKEHHNYVAFFLTLSCNLKCPYCINAHGENENVRKVEQHLSGDDWVKAANRLVLRDDLPLTLQGGEPTLHKDFYKIVNDVSPEIKMDLLTNMAFNVDEFISNVPVWRFSREAPYAAIRVSYHPGQNDIDELIDKTFKMQKAGFRVGLYSVEHPDKTLRKHIHEIQKRCIDMGIDFRLKEFLGDYNGTLYGTFKYEGCVNNENFKKCKCRTTELIVDPSGYIYKCHADLYNHRNHFAHILDNNFTIDDIDKFRECEYYGSCNPCDVKVKTNRFQIFGHTSVEITDIE